MLQLKRASLYYGKTTIDIKESVTGAFWPDGDVRHQAVCILKELSDASGGFKMLDCSITFYGDKMIVVSANGASAVYGGVDGTTLEERVDIMTNRTSTIKLENVRYSD